MGGRMDLKSVLFFLQIYVMQSYIPSLKLQQECIYPFLVSNSIANYHEPVNKKRQRFVNFKTKVKTWSEVML